MDRPTVSLLMPAYNAARHLRLAVQSVLAQSFDDFELVVVDDGSTDATPEVLADFTDSRVIRLRNAENLGHVSALNRALQVARGSYIARQDADDISLPGRLAAQVEFLESEPQTVLLGTALEIMDGEGQTRQILARPETDTEIRWWMLFQNAFAHSSVMIRRSALTGLRYEASLVPAEDYALWWALLKKGRGANLHEPLVRYRRHFGQISQERAASQRELADAISGGILAELGVEVSNEELRVLRDWMFSTPRSLGRAEIRHFGRSMEILEAFGRQPGLDARALSAIRRRWARRAVAGLPARYLGEAWRVGLLPAALRRSPVGVALDLGRRLQRRLLRATRRAS